MQRRRPTVSNKCVTKLELRNETGGGVSDSRMPLNQKRFIRNDIQIDLR